MQGLKLTLNVKLMISNNEKGRVRKADSRKDPHDVQENFLHAAGVFVTADHP